MSLTVIQDQQIIGTGFGMTCKQVNLMDQIIRDGLAAEKLDVKSLDPDHLRVFQLAGNLKDWAVTDSFGKQNGGNTLVNVLPDPPAPMEARGIIDPTGK